MNKIVFTNGCFDIIHAGHIDLLTQAKKLGDKLIVGINSDESVRSIKGANRPILSQGERAAILKALESVDEVKIFSDLTPENLIKELKPDVLVKGGDWKESEIIGADFVKENGGEVHSIPLKEGYSSTNIIEKIVGSDGKRSEYKEDAIDESDRKTLVKKVLTEHIRIFEKTLDDQISQIEHSAELILSAVEKDGKILLCGNGGSAADAQHIATEFVVRYETERKAVASIALTTDTSVLTASANDYSFEHVFSRQIEALSNEGDVLIAISTSGNSPNIIKAVMTARNKGCKIIGLTGKNGKKLAALCDACVMVPAEKTSRIQEAHITIGHIFCEIVDRQLAEND